MAIDMSAVCARAVRLGLPGAVVIVDRFHLVKKANEMVDAVRRRVTLAQRGRRGRKVDVDTHGLIIGEVELDPVGDLLRTPSLHPRSVLAVRLVNTGPPRRLRPCYHRTIGSADLTQQPLLDIGTQPRIGDQHGQVQGGGLRRRRVILRCDGIGGQCRGGVLLFARGVVDGA